MDLIFLLLSRLVWEGNGHGHVKGRSRDWMERMEGREYHTPVAYTERIKDGVFFFFFYF